MNSKPFLIIGIIISFVVASMLNVSPLGYDMASVRPMFLAMVLALSQAWVLGVIALSVYQVSLWILQAFSHAQFVWTGMGSLMSSIVLFPVMWYPLYWINRQLKERAY